MVTKLNNKMDYFYTGYTIMTSLAFVWLYYYKIIPDIPNIVLQGYRFTLFATMTVDMKYILDTTMSMISLYTTMDTVGRLFGAASTF